MKNKKPSVLDNDDIGIDLKDEDFEESSNNWEPQRFDNDTFKQRNDPKPLIMRFKLQLMNAYVVEVTDTDPVTGVVKTRQKIHYKKHTAPLANKTGIEEIVSYLENIVNSHIVQANITSVDLFNRKMLFIADDVTMHFMSNRERWGVHIKQIDVIISKTINLFDLFLTRTLFNEERTGYGQSYKETTHRDLKPVDKPNIFERIGQGLAGWNPRR